MRKTWVLGIAAISGVIIACGGSGGGDSSTGTTATTATSATGTTATTATTATGTTATTATTSTTSGAPGVLPKNRILYTEQLESGESVARHVGSSGETDTLLFTFTSFVSAYAPNPVNAAQIFFGAKTTEAGSYRLYRNSTPSVSGAVSISPENYVTIDAIQVAGNGSFLLFTADTGDGTPRLYRVNLTPTLGTPTLIDTAYFFHLASDNNRVVYSKNGPTDLDLFVRNLSAGTSTGITATGDDVYPQWSKAGDRIIYSSNSTGGFLDVYRVNPDGTNRTRLTDTPDDSEFGASYNEAATSMSYAIASGTPENSGLYRLTFGGTRTLIKASPGILNTYWTNSDGKYSRYVRIPGSGPVSTRLRRLFPSPKPGNPADSPKDQWVDGKKSDAKS